MSARSPRIHSRRRRDRRAYALLVAICLLAVFGFMAHALLHTHIKRLKGTVELQKQLETRAANVVWKPAP